MGIPPLGSCMTVFAQPVKSSSGSFLQQSSHKKCSSLNTRPDKFSLSRILRLHKLHILSVALHHQTKFPLTIIYSQSVYKCNPS